MSSYMTQENEEEFIKLTEPLIKFLCHYGTPYVSVNVTPLGAELLEPTFNYYTEEHLVD